MTQKTIILCSILVLTSFLRFIPHPPNLTPVIAITILSVAHFRNPLSQFGCPLAIMLITDFFIGFHSLMPIVYAALVISGLTGYLLKKKMCFSNIIGSGLLSSILFFTLTNLGVWALGSLYPHTLQGLMMCYTAAIPFFHNTVLGTCGVLMGVYTMQLGWLKINKESFLFTKLT